MSAAVARVVELPTGSYDPTFDRTPTAEQYASFDAAFTHFNLELFGGSLPPVMLTFAKSGKSRGHYIAKHRRRREGQDGRLGEIALSPDALARDEREVAATLVHEMTHHWQHIDGTPGRRGYHNREWGARMEALGLMPSSTGAPGGNRTGQRMTHYIVEDGPFMAAYGKLGCEVLLPFIAGSPAVEGKPGLKKVDPSKSKFTCQVCHDSARGKPSLMIDCRKCGVPMTLDAPATNGATAA
jgi:hypothetical protein